MRCNNGLGWLAQLLGGLAGGAGLSAIISGRAIQELMGGWKKGKEMEVCGEKV